MKKIEIKYFSDEIEKLRYIDGKSDWIDLRASEDVVLKKGEFKLIPLGIAMKLPEGYEAHVVPRSSTFKNFGIIQTNSFGVIDNSYCGDDDMWHFPALAIRDTEIHKNDRICQFRIMKNQPKIEFDEEISPILKSSAILSTGLISSPSEGAQPKSATKFTKASVKYPCSTKSETAVAPCLFESLLLSGAKIIPK